MVTLDEYLEIQALAKQGLTKTQIVQQMGLDRHTIAKLFEGNGWTTLGTKAAGQA